MHIEMTRSYTLFCILLLVRLQKRPYKKDQAGVEEQPEHYNSLKDHSFDTAQEAPNKNKLLIKM